MTTLLGRVARRGRLWAGFRCEEPLVVLESDDWGLRRRPAAEEVARWGTPSGWADEHGETAEDLDRLTRLLAGHTDPDGRTAALTMNVIAANPDREAIEAGGFEAYVDRPVDETLPAEVRGRLRAGVAAGQLSLQLHGRAHFNVERWLADLRSGEPGARELFTAGVDGGLSLTREHGWRYHSELLDWTAGTHRSTAELVAWLSPAVDTVERLGGVRPRSAVAPHYVLSDEAEAAWAELGLEFVQSAERQLRPGHADAKVSYLGQPGRDGLVHLTRTARFDPRPGRQGHHVADAAAALRRCFDQGLPAVVDTHRINFTGPWAARAVDELDELLAVADEGGARYLTTPELGEAVRDDGSFVDAVTGAGRRLTPVGSMARAVTRPVLSRR
jgi:hypothetical protein